MISVLQSWREINRATEELQSQGLPTHITIQKNWDQFLLHQLLTDVDRRSFILDLGCGDCCTLDFLAALGFKNLHGIDLQIKKQSENLPYTLYQGDMTKTALPDQIYDSIVSISVIEHGVNLEAFFKESHRLLKPNGLLFLTTDYWQEKIAIDASIQPFGLTWNIFSQYEIQAAIALANQYGFALEQNIQIPSCIEETVSWYDKHYTFIALALRKRS